MIRYMVGAIIWSIFFVIFFFAFLGAAYTHGANANAAVFGVFAIGCGIGMAANISAYIMSKKMQNKQVPNSQQSATETAITQLKQRISELEKANAELVIKANSVTQSQELLNNLKSEIGVSHNKLAETQSRILDQTQKLNDLNTKYEDIYKELAAKAEAEAVSKKKAELEPIEKELEEKTKELNKVKTQTNTLSIKFATMKTQYQSYQTAVKNYLSHSEHRLDESFLSSLSPTIEIELQCFSLRQLRKLFNQNKELIQSCCERYEKRYTTKTNAALYKLMTIALEAELQNVLFDIKYGKLETSVDNIHKMCERYYTIATDGNQSIAPTVQKFIGEIEYLFVEAVKIEYEYYVQRERIKEEQRAIREQMRQEVEERKALERERKRIEQEEQKYRNEIENIRAQLETAEPEKVVVLNERIAELETQINEVEDKREQILSLENGKAGYVYIISNIGSFGEDVYKIGMTRRMEPMERINELGSASVPFPFDVHGMIFSDDAVGLEHNLHTIFTNYRVNKVNLRKEFFRVSLDEIEKVVDETCPSAEFKRTALAEQYRQSLTMVESASELSEEDMKETV